MPDERDINDLDESLRHCRAAMSALQSARDNASRDLLYPTHIHLAAVEMAHAIETSMKVALRNQ